MRKTFPKGRVIGLLIFITTIFSFYFYFRSWLTLPYIQAHVAVLQEWVMQHYWYAVAAYIGVYILIALAGLPLAAMATVVSGYLFGTVPASFYTIIAATIGGLLFFLLVRHAFGLYFQEKYAERMVTFNKKFQEKGALYLLSVRLIPFIPFAVVNTLAGLTRISIGNFIWTTSLGIIPTAILFAYAGRQLCTITSFYDIFSTRVLLAFGLLFLISVVPLLWPRIKKLFGRS